MIEYTPTQHLHAQMYTVTGSGHKTRQQSVPHSHIQCETHRKGEDLTLASISIKDNQQYETHRKGEDLTLGSISMKEKYLNLM